MKFLVGRDFKSNKACFVCFRANHRRGDWKWLKKYEKRERRIAGCLLLIVVLDAELEFCLILLKAGLNYKKSPRMISRAFLFTDVLYYWASTLTQSIYM